LGITQGGGTSLEEDQEELTRLLQECAERKRANVVRTAKKSVKQQIRQDVASGKRAAYYPKRSELKRMEAEAKYTEIRKRGGEEAVNKAISKRRKKNMSKEAKSMPSHMIS
jgi:ribosomal RNA-processing protein 36